MYRTFDRMQAAGDAEGEFSFARTPQNDGGGRKSPAGGRTRRFTGFTLIELLIALTLVFILVGAVLLVYDAGFKAFYTEEKGNTLQSQAAQVVTALSGDLRGATSLTSAAAAAVTFTADTDANGVDESITYSWSGTVGEDLVRVSAVSVPVAHSVQSLTLSYYDAGDNLLSFPVTASQARRVGFDLTLSEADEVFRLRSSVRLRNL